MRYEGSFNDAYRGTLIAIRDRGARVDGIRDPTSIGSKFGQASRPTRELLADSFSISNPRDRLLSLGFRNVNRAFLVANTIWTLAGGHDVGMIAAYNSRGRLFAKDNSFFEASFGSRLFSAGHQLRHVERRLRADMMSRRGTAAIYSLEDTLTDRLDVPCALALQFFIRTGSLHCLTIMRSQSAAMVMPYDVFLFTMIQEILAVRLGVGLGTYLHFAASMHFYEEEAELISHILQSDDPPAPLMPVMTDASDSVLEELINAEQYLRHSSRLPQGADSRQLEVFKLDKYWRDFLKPLLNDSFS